MWETLKPEVLARLPRSVLNGTANGTPGSGSRGDRGSWEKCLTDLNRFRSYGDDWDGQGAAFGHPAKAISGELIDSAVALVEVLRRSGIDAPLCTLPDVQGTVGFEWESDGGSSITLDILEPGTAEMFLFAPGKPTEHVTLTETAIV